jgi:hypothetical protein
MSATASVAAVALATGRRAIDEVAGPASSAIGALGECRVIRPADGNPDRRPCWSGARSSWGASSRPH